MNKFFFSFTLSLLFTFPSEADVRGVKRADKIIKIKRPDLESSHPGESSVQRCLIFSDFVVIEIDSFKKGAERIAVREISKKITPESACNSITLAGEVVMDISSEYVYGVAGDFLFTEGSDGLGKTNWMNVYSKKSSGALQRLNYHSEKDFIVTQLKDSLAIEFYTHLKLSCTLASEDSSCWEKIKKENRIPGDIVEKPKCEDVFTGNAFKSSPKLKNSPRAIQVYAKASIEDVKAKKLTYLKGAATCDLTH